MDYRCNRKAHRDCPVRHALVNMLEDMDAAQYMIDDGRSHDAQQEVLDAVGRFRSVVKGDIRDLIVAVDLGRIRVTLDYSDEAGEMNITYIARRIHSFSTQTHE